MKSVGEVMAMGRTWIESLQKALRGMEAGLDGWALPRGYKRLPKDQLLYNLRVPNPDRMIYLKQVRLIDLPKAGTIDCPAFSKTCWAYGWS